MSYIDKSCSEFAEILAAGTPVPGGGSAAALAGAVGTALGNMVGSLTAARKNTRMLRTICMLLWKKRKS